MNHAQRREALTTAATLRQRGKRLETLGQVLQTQADELDAEVRGRAKEVLRGREITEMLYALVRPGEVVHYRAAYARLLVAGFDVVGTVPQNTLLAALQRSPNFVAVGRRTGKYKRRGRLQR
jgi:hypothetical protein